MRQRRGTGAPIGVLMVLALLASLVLAAEGVYHPVGLAVSVPTTALALGVVVAGYLWLDRWEPEPSRLLLLAFLWGASVAAIASLVLELATSDVLGDGIVLQLVGPMIEEAAKGGFLLIMLTGVRRAEFDGVVDGLVYAGLTAVGFAFVEDAGYIAESFGQGTKTGITTVVLRLVIAPFAHPLFTSLIGIGFGLYVTKPARSPRWIYPAAGYLGAVALHSLWNSSLRFGPTGYVIVYLAIMVPALGGAISFARNQRHRERDIVTRQLPALVHDQLITASEAGWLSSIAARQLALRRAKVQSGTDGVRAVRALQGAVTELAFLRNRVERGTAPPNAYYLHEELAQRVRIARVLTTTGP